MPYAETFKRSLERPDTLGVNSGLQRRVGSSSSTMSVLAVLSRARLASAFSLSSTRIARSGHHATRLVALAPLPQTRSYAKASKKSKGKGKQVEEEPEEEPEDFSHSQKGAKRKKVSTDDLVPASQRIVASKEYKDAESKMETALAWFRREVSAAETRATGRVTPAILEPVRVRSRDGPSVRLEEVATVGVRDGTMLLVTVFEESVSPLMTVVFKMERSHWWWKWIGHVDVERR